MQVKRFRQKTLQEALREAREALGPDALVLSSRDVQATGAWGWLGRREIEVTAAAERPVVSEDRPREAAEDQGPPVPPVLEDAETLAMLERARATAEIAARLRATGLDEMTAAAVAEALPPTRRRGVDATVLRRTLAAQMAPLVAKDEKYAPIEVFVGPPGVGKTTTIAKIAAEERTRRGRRVALVSADGFRMGAVEQLRLYADIFGAPFTAARSAEELEIALDGRMRPLLIDTAGRSQLDDDSRQILQVLAKRKDVRTHLVLSANTPRDHLRRVFDRFADALPTRVVITKLDEVESLGGLVPLLQERGLPVSYVASGQSVPGDLARATPEMLAAWVAGEGVGMAA